MKKLNRSKDEENALRRKWRIKNKERENQRWRDWYKRNNSKCRIRRKELRTIPEAKKKASVANKLWRYNLKLEVFNAYGGPFCVCCGEMNIGFLTLDHIKGCLEGRKRKDTTTRLYSKLRKMGYPEGYQVLCYNCNLGRAHNNGICPHKQNKS